MHRFENPISIRAMPELRSERLFVYGTLRHGGAAGTMLRGCRLLRAELVRGALYDLGEYPALVLGGAGSVRGEVWSCPPETLHDLDSYEQAGAGLFERVRIDLDDGPCWTYVAGPLITARLEGVEQVAGGDWVAATAARSRKGERTDGPRATDNA
jgi:gamma-glutamylcyclotransferase (GGCT)/AIG2-like uncharacterized protein YtfP